MLLPTLTECKQEITPGPGPLNSWESDSSDVGTITMIWEEEKGDQMVHQLAGLGDRAESPLGSEYWERDGDLGPEYDEVVK